MVFTVEIGGNQIQLETREGIDISIPLSFQKKQLKFFGVPKASAKLYTENKFIGSTLRGGDCNVESVLFIPHCHMTHTECVGHILEKPGDIGILLRDIIIPGLLITVSSIPFGDSLESYHCAVRGDEQVISKKLIQNEVEML